MLLADSGNLAVMTLLDLSAAFDSVDHTTLLRQLQTSYGLCGTVLNWLTSYLTGRMQYVPTMASSSASCADRSSMFCTPPTCCLWYKVTAWHHTPMSMIHRLCICQPSETDILQLLGRRFSMHSDKETAVGPKWHGSILVFVCASLDTGQFRPTWQHICSASVDCQEPWSPPWTHWTTNMHFHCHMYY